MRSSLQIRRSFKSTTLVSSSQARGAKSTDGSTAQRRQNRAAIMISQAPIFTIHAELADVRHFGQTPYGERRGRDILGGRVGGARVQGKSLPGAGWRNVPPGGVAELQARYRSESEDRGRVL